MLVEIYVNVDDFCKENQEVITKLLKESGQIKKAHPSKLILSEVMTILIYYHQSYYKNFKGYYINHVQKDLRADFPDLVSYNRFVELIPRAFYVLLLYNCYRCSLSKKTGRYYVDSSRLEVCHSKRVHQHKVMRGFCGWGKSSMGWFYGLKYHLITNNLGEIMSFSITAGNVADNHPKLLQTLTKNLCGFLFGDRGYLLRADKKEMLEREGLLKIFTKTRKNMKPKDIPVEARLWLKKRGVIESSLGVQKNTCDIWHTRHRSSINAFVHMLAGIAAYSFRERKPSTSIQLEKRLLAEPKIAQIAA